MSEDNKVRSLAAKLTPQDAKVMQAHLEEQRQNPPPPRLKTVKDGTGIGSCRTTRIFR
jgi:hypothetical protein